MENHSPQKSSWLTLSEALEHLASRGYAISKKTMYNKLQANEGPECKYFFGRYRFTQQALDRWLDSNTESRRAYGVR